MTANRIRPAQMALAIAAVAWSFAIIAAPILAASGSSSATNSYAILQVLASFICHQRPDRSFQTAGVVWPVCARCTGIYAAAAVGAVMAMLLRARPTWWSFVQRARVVLVLAAAPSAVTLMVEWMFGVTTSNAIRALSGLPLGAALAWTIITAAGSDQSVEVH